MYISKIEIRNFRILQHVYFTLEKETTVIVGRNNSGKTTIIELFRKMLQGNTFRLEDFNSNSIETLRVAIQNKVQDADWITIEKDIPQIEMRLHIDYSDNTSDFGFLGNFLIELKEDLTESIISFKFSLPSGRLNDFFKDIPEPTHLTEFYKWLAKVISSNFATTVSIIDPTDVENTLLISLQEIRKLIHIDIISAQRGLDDNTEKERDILGKTLSEIFQYSSSETAPQEMRDKLKELELVFQGIQRSLDEDVKAHVDNLLPAMENFGFPRLGDPKLSTETTVDLGNLLAGNTRIKYKCADSFSLPETYNGLGTRNLIYILFCLWGCFKKFQTTMNPDAIHVIFIEEPEAHLHPQMQEVFIRHLSTMIDNFQKDMPSDERWNIQFIVSTHSSHIANETNFKNIRYFTASSNSSIVKDLNKYFTDETIQEDIQFIRKYMSLTQCDLFFADKAILVEGITERILLPLFMRSSAPTLRNQYVSIVEVGGAYAHHFYKFLKFIGLQSLIITDIDSVKRVGKVYQKCIVSEGVRSSNAALNNWVKLLQNPPLKYNRPIMLSSIFKAPKACDNIRIAFQISEGAGGKTGRSFEDAFMLANKEYFFTAEERQSDNLDEIAFDKAKEKNNCKADFALEIAMTDKAEPWSVPAYIKDGLLWLGNVSAEEKTNDNKQ